MLGTPPAFILSQDQTLNENGILLVFWLTCAKILRKQVWQVKICLISSLKTNVFAFANSFWIIVFFKKLSRNSPLNCLTNSLIVSNFIWLNFYTMKFSRFRFSVVLNVFILTQPVNIVKRFFLFHQVFIKSMENFRRCCFATAWLLYQTAHALSRTFSNFFRTFSFQPIRFRVAVREKPVCSQATAWLYYHSLLFPSSAFRKLF